MRIIENPRIPAPSSPAFASTLQTLLNQIVAQLNGLGDGRIYVVHSAATAAPTGGTWSVGDIVWNSAPTELGTTPNKYVVDHWRCVASGTPGTWVAVRGATGN